eukprot:TRINITY_DN62671_c0_g1_i1.p1 TRINITY_DN62671_c0_g1~~TRINITY_DN62671_c0_g1_i1.p1  ORF type:complete len:233 (-),score=28.05 TRINITY_DN62671_c0_g1_i1:157-855(-)
MDLRMQSAAVLSSVSVASGTLTDQLKSIKGQTSPTNVVPRTSCAMPRVHSEKVALSRRHVAFLLAASSAGALQLAKPEPSLARSRAEARQKALDRVREEAAKQMEEEETQQEETAPVAAETQSQEAEETSEANDSIDSSVSVASTESSAADSTSAEGTESPALEAAVDDAVVAPVNESAPKVDEVPVEAVEEDAPKEAASRGVNPRQVVGDMMDDMMSSLMGKLKNMTAKAS